MKARPARPSGALVVARVPAGRLAPEGRQRLARLLASLLAHPDPTVRVDVLRRLAQLPLDDPGRALLPGLLAALGSALPDEVATAAVATFATYTGRQADLVGRAVAMLLPRRRSLAVVVSQLCGSAARDPERMRPTVRAVLAALAADPLTVSLRVRLAVLALPAAELAAWLTEVAVARELHADALGAAVRAMDERALYRGPAALEPVELALAASAGEGLRLIALNALVAANGRVGVWTDAHLARLAAYRRDPSPLVAGAAQFTFSLGVEEAGE